MAARSFTGCELTTAQSEALTAVGITSVSDISCTSGSLNTCGLDANTIIGLYGLYDPDKGDYYEWQSIGSTWSLSEYNWSEVVYIAPFSYENGDFSVLVEDEGYRVVVYESAEDIPIFPGLFNPSQWNKFCEVTISAPINVWGPLSNYSYFSSSTQYTAGDIVLFDLACGNITCISQLGGDSTWKKLICLENGKDNKCEKRIECGPGRVIVDLGGETPNLVCVPVESSVGVGPRGYESLR